MGEKRKSIIVKRKFQHNIALIITLALFILINILFVVGYFIVESMTDIQQLKETLAYVIAAVELVSLGLIYRLSIKESHRIAGPLFVLERSLKNIKEGELNFTMSLRSHDHFHETADIFNETLTDLKRRIGDSQTLATQLRETLKETGEQRALADQLVQQLSHYRVDNHSSGS